MPSSISDRVPTMMFLPCSIRMKNAAMLDQEPRALDALIVGKPLRW
jgi:hypothetical protein